MRLNLFLQFFFIILSFEVSAQRIDYQLNFEGLGQVYSNERSPFWLHTNKKGRIDEKSHISTLLTGSGILQIGDSTHIELGIGTLYKDGFEDGIKLDEVYFEFNSRKVGMILGKKHKKDIFQGLSATNENILWSLNSGAMPGLQIYTRYPIFLGKEHGIGVMAELEEYLMDDNRYVEKTRLHHKSFHLVYKSPNDFQIALGVQHYVQWAGISPTYGKLPNSFIDYTRVFFGMAGDNGVGGEEVNALGNQLGSYEIRLKSQLNGLDLQFLYNHIFEDASGMKMGNFPDGRYALYIEDNRDTFWGTSWLKALMYEFYYTKNQSRSRKSSEVDGGDNYFNNNLYRSGWTYDNQVVGVPYILLNENRFRIANNILLVHHLGLKGEFFKSIPYRLILSYRDYGLTDTNNPNNKEIFSGLVEFDFINSAYKVKAQLGYDISPTESPNLGVGINFTKAIF
ncbi:capsule assembly Wzi family protein [Gramella sp. KN1008]|uniref:capsule assembly Wzi family protein n=1 Tax=Gramella sp. KN1008 TaxID=2529298 RepID=UPI001039C92E|nr:capsule assembly Wzi family protein [Gramella sp. KN1008]TBW26435.1 hypothetical protein EZJ28_14630 [Gramella sp. KN1008]